MQDNAPAGAFRELGAHLVGKAALAPIGSVCHALGPGADVLEFPWMLEQGQWRHQAQDHSGLVCFVVIVERPGAPGIQPSLVWIAVGDRRPQDDLCPGGPGLDGLAGVHQFGEVD